MEISGFEMVGLRVAGVPRAICNPICNRSGVVGRVRIPDALARRLGGKAGHMAGESRDGLEAEMAGKGWK